MSITVAPDNGKSKQKPVPSGFDPKNPPKVYWAPECVGTRPVEAKSEQDTDYLRKYKKKHAAEKAN